MISPIKESVKSIIGVIILSTLLVWHVSYVLLIFRGYGAWFDFFGMGLVIFSLMIWAINVYYRNLWIKKLNNICSSDNFWDVFFGAEIICGLLHWEDFSPIFYFMYRARALPVIIIWCCYLIYVYFTEPKSK